MRILTILLILLSFTAASQVLPTGQTYQGTNYKGGVGGDSVSWMGITPDTNRANLQLTGFRKKGRFFTDSNGVMWRHDGNAWGVVPSSTDLNNYYTKNQSFKIYNILDYGATPIWQNALDDDGIAIQAAIDAWEADFRVYGTMGIIYTPDGGFHVRSPLQKFVQDTIPTNSQIVIPPFDWSYNTLKATPILRFEGASQGDFVEGPNRDEGAKYQTTGSVWISTIDNDGSSAPCMLGTYGYWLPPTEYYDTFRPNAIQVYIKNMHFQVKHDSANGGAQISGVDMRWASFGSGGEFCKSDVSVGGAITVEPTNNTFGFRWTGTNLGTNISVQNCMAVGHTYGHIMGEHTIAINPEALYNVNGIEITRADHAVVLIKPMVQNNRRQITAGNIAPIGISQPLIQGAVFESSGLGVDPAKWYGHDRWAVFDTGSYLDGSISFSNEGNIITTYGGDRLELYNIKNGLAINNLVVPSPTANALTIHPGRGLSLGAGSGNNYYGTWLHPAYLGGGKFSVGMLAGQVNGSAYEFWLTTRTGGKLAGRAFVMDLVNGGFYRAVLSAYSTGGNRLMVNNVTTGKDEAITGTVNQVVGFNANGDAVAVSNTVPDASASVSGIVNTTTQTFAGNKTFNGSLSIASALNIGAGISGSTATPSTINMGSSFANSTSSAGAKWKLYDDGVINSIYGIGISSGRFNTFGSVATTFNWVWGNVDRFTLNSTGAISLYAGAAIGNAAVPIGVGGVFAQRTFANGTNTTVTVGASNVTVDVSATPSFTSLTVSGVTIRSGTGSPESVVTAPVGSMFLRSDGGAGTTLYIKESGSGNTGWIAK